MRATEFHTLYNTLTLSTALPADQYIFSTDDMTKLSLATKNQLDNICIRHENLPEYLSRKDGRERRFSLPGAWWLSVYTQFAIGARIKEPFSCFVMTEFATLNVYEAVKAHEPHDFVLLLSGSRDERGGDDSKYDPKVGVVTKCWSPSELAESIHPDLDNDNNWILDFGEPVTIIPTGAILRRILEHPKTLESPLFNPTEK